MKPIDITNKTKEELITTLQELRAKFAQLNFDHADKKLKDSSQFKKTKKDIARVLTRLRQGSRLAKASGVARVDGQAA